MFSKISSKILNYLNNLNARQVITLAGVTAILMFVAIYVFLTTFVAEKEVAVKKVEIEMPRLETVIVAKSDIAPRMMIRENMLQTKEVPVSDVPNGAFTLIEDVVDHPARITILAGDVITKRKLYLDTNQAGFVGAIPPDCRAVSINVNNITGVAGFAKPGDYVDLLLVENNNIGATTTIILQNILLLSINQTMDRNEVDKNDDGDENPNAAINSPSIATLALRPNDALKLVSAAKLGDIYLMLRPSKPLDMYVNEIDYTVISSNAPTPQPVASTPPPAQKVEESKPADEPPVDTTPKFEIIYGAEIVQTPDDDKQSSNKGSSKK